MDGRVCLGRGTVTIFVQGERRGEGGRRKGEYPFNFRLAYRRGGVGVIGVSFGLVCLTLPCATAMQLGSGVRHVM